MASADDLCAGDFWELTNADFEPPPLTDGFAPQWTANTWGLTGATEGLVGERTANVAITDAASGRRYILQTQRADHGEGDQIFDMQTAALRHAERRAPHLLVSRVVSTIDGAPWARTTDGDTELIGRVVTFIEGVTFDDDALTDDEYVGVGRTIGQLAVALADFEHPRASWPMPWDIANGLITDDTMWARVTGQSAPILLPLRDRIERIARVAATFPRQPIHNDGHVDNLIRADESSKVVTGVIDFGDVVDTIRVADVAIAAESFAVRTPDPIAVTAALAAGYAETAPLTEDEIAAIGELVLARQVLTALLFLRHIDEVPRLRERATKSMPWILEGVEIWSALAPDQVADAIAARCATGTNGDK